MENFNSGGDKLCITQEDLRGGFKFILTIDEIMLTVNCIKIKTIPQLESILDPELLRSQFQ